MSNWIRDNKLQLLGRGGGKGGAEAYVPVEDPTSLQSHSYAKVLDVVCEGEIEGLVNGFKSIYLDGVPVQGTEGDYNYTGFNYSERVGLPASAQAPIPGFTDVESEISVGRQVLKGSPVRVPILEPNIEAVRVTIEIPALSQHKNNGDILGTEVSYRLNVYTNFSNPDDPDLDGTRHSFLDDTVRGKTSAPYRKSRVVPLSIYGPGPWVVEVERITDDSTDPKLANNLSWFSLTNIIYEKLSYPMTALMAVTVDSKYFSSIPVRGYDLKLLKIKIPSNYDPLTREYTGFWDGTFKIAWSDNPAWCFYDLVTNTRYGLADAFFDDSLVDKWELYKIAKYCDGLVPSGVRDPDTGNMGFEPRFTCNVYLQTREDAYTLLNQFTSIFRAAAYWDGNSLFVTQDAPKDPVALFTAANVENGMFSYEGSGLKARHTSASVSWNDPNLLYKRQVEYVEDADAIQNLGYRPLEVSAIGCTSRGQANRLGRWILATERYETQAINFVTGADASGLYPGTIIQVQDEYRSGLKYSGRIVAGDTNYITIDREVADNLQTGKQFTAYITMPSSANRDTENPSPVSSFMPNIEIVTATYSGNSNTYSVSPSLSEAPGPNAVWVFEDIGKDQTQLFRVMGVSEVGPLKYNVTGLEFQPGKFDAIDLDTELEVRDIAIANGIPSTPTGLTATEEIFESTIGLRSHVYLDWDTSDNSLKYKVEVNKDNLGWEIVSADSPGSSFLYTDAIIGATYQFRVKSHNSFGRYSSNYALISILVDGKTDLPGNVDDFSVVRGREALTLTWRHTSDPDRLGYEIRRTTDVVTDVEASWEANSAFILATDFSANGVLASKITSDSFITDLIEGGSYTYMIKTLNTSGSYSAEASTLQLSIAAPKKVQGLACIQNRRRIELVWYPNTEIGLIGYEVREGTSWASSIKVAEVTATRYSFSYGSYDRNRTFWVKAIVSPGIYSKTAARADTEVIQISDYNAVYTDTMGAGRWSVDGNFIDSHWFEDSDGTLVTQPNVTYSEFSFDIDIGTGVPFRAQTTISADYIMQGIDYETWDAANYTWDSESASRRWDPSVDSSLAELTFQIAPETMQYSANELHVWEFNSSLEAFGGSSSPDSGYRGVYFDTGSGRHYAGSLDFTQGDFKLLEYTVAIPRVFSWGMWVSASNPDRIQTQILRIENTSVGEYLSLEYSTYFQRFSLEDQDGNIFYTEEDFDISNTTGKGAEELIFVGISQTDESRSIYISNVSNTKEVFSTTLLTPSSTGYTKLKVA